MTGHHIMRKPARFICPLMLLVVPICGCNADQQATLRYWNQTVNATTESIE
jgi:hypothetical protein